METLHFSTSLRISALILLRLYVVSESRVLSKISKTDWLSQIWQMRGRIMASWVTSFTAIWTV